MTTPVTDFRQQIRLLSALEMYTNPRDLLVCVLENRETGEKDPTQKGKYSVWISRGAGHHYKPIITCNCVSDTVEQAIQIVESILLHVLTWTKETLNKKDSVFFQVFGVVILNPEQVHTLTESLITWIITQMREKNNLEVSTVHYSED